MNKLLITLPLTLMCSSTNAALVSRLGGLAYYDTESNLTWLTDANAIAGSVYDSDIFYGSSTDGSTTWASANAWATNLEVVGVSGWRLPTADPSCGSYNCTNSEMGNLFYNVFGGVGGSLTVDYENLTSNDNYKLFSNISTSNYWTSTEYSDARAFAFWFQTGYQGNYNKFNERRAWAVHTGDVAAVPVPAAIWLFGSGFIGLFGTTLRKNT